jgi:SSS family solute:Na+ symporter
MRPIDWFLFIGPVVCMLALAGYTNQFIRGVADFLAGGRCAGRYLLANAKGEAASGLANMMGKFELVMISGFTVSFWEHFSAPITLIVSVTGFVIYRYRETRALTVSQFLEMRYSRRFRIFMGAMAFLAGVLNYGIFPAVSARFFVYFLDLPPILHAGRWEIPTFVPIMAITMSIALVLLTVGGQVSLLITDCMEGLLSHLVYIAVVIAIFATVSWSQIVHVTSDLPRNHSMINPLDSWDVSDFNVWYVVMNLILGVYGTMAFQTSNGYYAAARTPHESRMSGILGQWRSNARGVMLVIVTLGAVAFMRHPDFATLSRPAHQAIDAVPKGELRTQVTVPVALRYLLPPGIKGLFCAAMIMGLMANDVTHIGTWSSIFIQDVVLPLRKTAPSPREHIWMLRMAIVGVVLFAFVFSSVFKQTQYITMWMNVSAGVFMAGAGAVIIGGLYWRRATSSAAWACMIIGGVLSLLGIALQKWWEPVSRWFAAYIPAIHPPAACPFNGEKSLFASSIIATVVYLLWSLVTVAEPFNLARMLHRDTIDPADSSDEIAETLAAQHRPRPGLLARLFGFDEHFTTSDKWITGLMIGWSLSLVVVNLSACLWNALIHPLSNHWWADYWGIVGVDIPFFVAAITFVWFSIGTFFDVNSFFHILRTAVRDSQDNGQVSQAQKGELHSEPSVPATETSLLA